MEIKWNQELFGVEIKGDENHFVVSAQPSMVMDWDDAVRYYKDNKVWKLPTGEQLQLIAKYIDEINILIATNGGYEIFGWFWSIDEGNESCAWYIDMDDGVATLVSKGNDYYVRAVSNLLGF